MNRNPNVRLIASSFALLTFVAWAGCSSPSTTPTPTPTPTLDGGLPDDGPRCLGLPQGVCALLNPAACADATGCVWSEGACGGTLIECKALEVESCESQPGCWVGCSYPMSHCTGECLDLSSDPLRCGACDNACAEGEACVDGRCECADPYHLDMCGSCNADAADDCPMDCAGEFGGSASLDECGVCDVWPQNDCVQDCAGVWGGPAMEDACGTCDADPDNDCMAGCATHQEAGACWILAADFESCGQACTGESLIYSELTATHTGGDGGQAACESILATFGHTTAGDYLSCVNEAQAGCGVLTSTGETCFAADALVSEGVGAFGYRRLCACVADSP